MGEEGMWGEKGKRGGVGMGSTAMGSAPWVQQEVGER